MTDTEHKRIALIAHCLLNQNSKVEDGAMTPARWEPVIDLLRERGYLIRQMPCPELGFAGARRFWAAREQYDTLAFRRHCRRLAKIVASVIEQHASAGDDVVIIGIDTSPALGIDFTPSSATWAGEPNIDPGDYDCSYIPGDGIYIQELRSELEERGLPMPRMTGIRHWFPDYDASEEMQRLEALLR